MLTENDTIISFNYDLVVEKLRDARNVRANQTPGLSGSKVDVVHPAPRVERAPGTCPLLKLHGSVNWQKFAADPSARVQPRDDDFALHCSPPQMAIATPGPSKMREADGFKCIWNLACDALKAAHAIVFVGFRFPETDAYALERLLGAIEENHPPPMTPALRLHVVLGEAGRHAKRLGALLERVGETRDESLGYSTSTAVTIHPLYGQDFFATFSRNGLVSR